MVKVREDLTGRVFGRLTVLEQAEDYINKKGIHHSMWLCQCICGNKTTVLGTDLTRKDKKHIVSCGHCYSNYRLFKDYGECHMKNGFVCLFDIEDYDLSNPKDLTAYFKSIERICRNSRSYKKLVDFLKHKPRGLEVILTGHYVSDELFEVADYVTEMTKVKHPYDMGRSAREGIEY